MKILFQSDLHLDYNKKKLANIEDEYIDYMKTKECDFLIITGDIASNEKIVRRVLRRLKEEANKNVYFTIGNHDIYDSKNSVKNLNKLSEQPNILVNESVVLNDEYVLIGGHSWYDYSFVPSNVDKETIKEHKRLYWGDGKKVNWDYEDTLFSKENIEKLKIEIEKYKDKKIILSNHFIPLEDFLIIKGDQKWDINNAFMGTKEMKKVIDENKNIKYVAFGHTHIRFGQKNINNVNYLCNPLGYFMEWETDNFIKELEKATFELKIN